MLVVQSSVRTAAIAKNPRRSLILVETATMDFDRFFRAEFATMVGLARTICGSHEQAEDIAQEAMAKAYRDWGKVSGYDKPGAWVRRVTINLAISRRRRIARELSFLRRSASEQPKPVVPDLFEGDSELWKAVQELPPRQRAAIALFYQEDLSTRDIADAMQCSVSTATSHLNQARTRLAKTFGNLDETRSARGEP